MVLVSPFDIHDDVTIELTTLSGADRTAVSDESVAGDPMRWVSAQNARNYYRPGAATEIEAAAGTGGGLRSWSPARIAEAIASLADSGVTDYDDLINIPIVRMDPAVASADTEFVLIWDGYALYGTRGHGHIGKVVQWGTPNGTPLPINYAFGASHTYRGTLESDFNLPSDPVTGDVYYVRQGSYWTQQLASGFWNSYAAPHWIGAFAYERDAKARASIVGQIAAFNDDDDITPLIYPYRVDAIQDAEPEDWYLVGITTDPARLLPDPTGHVGSLLEVTPAGEWGFARFPDPVPVHVGRIPIVVTAGDPDLVFLSHPYSIGNRSDATITVGVNGSFVGYLHDGIIGISVGSIDKVSPLVELRGFGTADNFEADSAYAFNKGWLEGTV